MSISIQKKYFDILAFSSSPENKNKTYHLGYPELLVLQKLINYERSDKYITYSNRIIANHLFRKERQIEKIILSLIKKGFINSKVHTVVHGKDNIAKKRTITINWDFFQTILDEIEGTLPTIVQPSKMPTDNKSKDLEQSEDNTPTPATVVKPKPDYTILENIIDIVGELAEDYQFADEAFINDIVDDYEEQIATGALSQSNYNQNAIRTNIANLIYTEKKLKIAS